MSKSIWSVFLVLALVASDALAQGGVRGVYNLGSNTAVADTLIELVIPPRTDSRTRIMKLEYTSAGTAHTVTLMKPLGEPTTLTAAAGTGQAVINIAADVGVGTVAGAIAAGDYLVVRKESTGIVYLVKVSSIATLAVTLTANVPVAFASGDKVWDFGIPGNVRTNVIAGHMPLLPPVSATTAYNSTEYGEGIFTTDNRDDPVIISSTNATAAGTVKQAAAVYLDYGTPNP